MPDSVNPIKANIIEGLAAQFKPRDEYDMAAKAAVVNHVWRYPQEALDQEYVEEVKWIEHTDVLKKAGHDQDSDMFKASQKRYERMQRLLEKKGNCQQALAERLTNDVK